MKSTASKDFGNYKKPLLPLVREPTKISKKEDLAQVDLLSNPTDANSTKVKFSFKALQGGNEMPCEVIQQLCIVERAFTGPNSNTGTLRRQMIQQFAQGSALSTFNTSAPRLAQQPRLATAAAAAQEATNTECSGDVAIADRLQATLNTLEGLDNNIIFRVNVIGTGIITTALQELTDVTPPNKIP